MRVADGVLGEALASNNLASNNLASNILASNAGLFISLFAVV